LPQATPPPYAAKSGWLKPGILQSAFMTAAQPIFLVRRTAACLALASRSAPLRPHPAKLDAVNRNRDFSALSSWNANLVRFPPFHSQRQACLSEEINSKAEIGVDLRR
jgi:hypothetical protein